MRSGQQPVFAFETVTAVLARFRRREERAEIVGMDAALPLLGWHRCRTGIDTDGTEPRLIDPELVVGEMPVPDGRLRELEGRPEFGRQLHFTFSGFGSGTHDRLSSPALRTRTLTHLHVFHQPAARFWILPKSPPAAPRHKAFS